MREHYSKAVEFYKKGEYEKAIAELKENLKLDSDHQPSKNLLKKAKLKLKLKKSELKKEKKATKSKR